MDIFHNHNQLSDINMFPVDSQCFTLLCFCCSYCELNAIPVVSQFSRRGVAFSGIVNISRWIFTKNRVIQGQYTIIIYILFHFSITP